MKPKYRAEHDGLTWTLFRESDVEKRVEGKKPGKSAGQKGRLDISLNSIR